MDIKLTLGRVTFISISGFGRNYERMSYIYNQFFGPVLHQLLPKAVYTATHYRRKSRSSKLVDAVFLQTFD
jgi:hypothetical protein